jgi:hypothetical protein
MYPEDTTSSGNTLGVAPWLLPPADEALVVRLLTRFHAPAVTAWAWLTSDVASTGARPCSILVSIDGARRRMSNQGVLPPDCPPLPWAAWGRLYASDETPQSGANIAIWSDTGL